MAILESLLQHKIYVLPKDIRKIHVILYDKGNI